MKTVIKFVSWKILVAILGLFLLQAGCARGPLTTSGMGVNFSDNAFDSKDSLSPAQPGSSRQPGSLPPGLSENLSLNTPSSGAGNFAPTSPGLLFPADQSQVPSFQN